MPVGHEILRLDVSVFAPTSSLNTIVSFAVETDSAVLHNIAGSAQTENIITCNIVRRSIIVDKI